MVGNVLNNYISFLLNTLGNDYTEFELNQLYFLQSAN